MLAFLPVLAAAGFFLVYFAAVAFFNARRTWWLFNQAGKHHARAYNSASRIMGTCHFLLVVPSSFYALCTGYPWEYAGPNSELEIRIMQISMGYFIADFYHFWTYERDDIPVVLHHITCLLFFSQVIFEGHGGEAAMVAIFAGEVTNPLQSAWFLARQAENAPLVAKLSPWFTAIFAIVRAVILPIWCIDVILGLVAGTSKGLLGVYVAGWWVFMMVCMLLGSAFWTYKVLLGFSKSKNKLKQQQ